MLAVGLGALLLRLPRALPVPALSRFCAGLALAPFVTGAWMMAGALLWPHAPREVMATGLVALAALLFMRGLRRLPRALIRAWRAQAALPGGAWTTLPLVMMAAVAFALLAQHLWRNALQPVSAHDALNYLSEARYFLAERGLPGMLDMGDAPDGSVRGNTHGFLFTAMLAAALCFSDGVSGYPQDFAARLALQLTLPAMLCALLALAGLLRRRAVGALALLMVLGVAPFEYVSFAASRDAFRIAALLLFALLLEANGDGRTRAAPRIALAVGAALAVTAHTLNILVVAVATAVSLGVMLWERRGWRPTAWLAGAVGVGVLLASERYIASYRDSGQLWGELPSRYALQGSVLDGAWQHLERYAGSHALGAVDKLGVLLARDGGWLSGAGLLAALALLLVATGRRRAAMRGWALTSLALIAPLSGMFDIEPYRLSDWFVENLRYALHWYPWLALVLVATLLCMIERAARRGGMQTRVSAVGIVLVSVVYGALAVYTLEHAWRGEKARSAARQGFETQLALLEKLAAELGTGQRLGLDDLGYQYYLAKPALILGARPSWPLLRAADQQQALARLDALGIGALVFKKASLPGWYERLPLYQAVNDSAHWRRAGETRAVVAYQRVDLAPRDARAR